MSPGAVIRLRALKTGGPVTVALALLMVLLALTGCGDPPRTEAETEIDRTGPKRVTVHPVSGSAAEGVLEVVGVLRADRKALISSEVGGVIERLHFDKGDRVQKGQLLAEIGASSARIQVLQAQAALAEARSHWEKVEKGSRPEEIRIAEAAHAEARAALTEAEKSFARVKNLAHIRAVPDSEFDAAKRRLDMARAQMESSVQHLSLARQGPRLEDRQAARAGWKRAEANMALAEDRLGKSLIRAPCAGVVSFRDAEEGEVLVIPPAKVIGQVVDVDRLKVAVSVGEKDIHILRELDRFPFTVDALPHRNFFCRLSFLSPAAEPATRSFPVELAVESPHPHMADGMTARVRFPLIGGDRTIKIPSAWLSEEGGAIGVFVLEDGAARFRRVTLGAYYDQRVEILSGLQEGDEIITNPAGLRTGDEVERE